MGTSNPPSAVTPSRIGLIAIMAFGCGVGLVPYLLFIDRLVYLWAAVPASAALAFLALRDVKAEAAVHPSFAEWLLAAWSAVSKPSTASWAGLMLYGLSYGGQRLFASAARLLGFAPGGDPSAWGYWGSIWVVGMMVIVSATEGAKELARQLYPREAWSRSVFSPLVPSTRVMVLGVSGAVLVLGAMFWLLDPRGVALPILLSLVCLYTSIPLARLGEARSDEAHAQVVDALAALLQEAGYRIMRSPRTGKAEIDPLLQSVDLLAKRPDRAFALEVKSVAAEAPVEWNEASAVRTAAMLLSDEIVGESGAAVPVEPVLLVVGGTVAQSLEAFSQRERVPVIHFADAAGATGDRHALASRLETAGLAFPARPPAAAGTV